MERIRVVIVDPSGKVRADVRRVLEMCDEAVELAGEAADTASARKLVAEVVPDVILLSLKLPEGGADEVGPELVASVVPEPVLVGLVGEKARMHLSRAMRAGIKHFLTKPFAPADLVEMITSAHRAQRRRLHLQGESRRATGAPGRVVTFFSAKGGVGKTSLLVNLACELGRRGEANFAVADLDFQFGDVGSMMGLAPERSLSGLLHELPPWTPELVEEYTIPSPAGPRVLLSVSSPEHAEEIVPPQVEDVIEGLRTTHPLVLVDTSSRFGALEKALLGRSDDFVLVVSPEATTVKNARFCLDVLRQMGVQEDRIHVVVNRGHPPTGGLEPEVIGERLESPIALVVPSGGKKIVESVNRGEPFMVKARRGGYAGAIRALADLVQRRARRAGR